MRRRPRRRRWSVARRPPSRLSEPTERYFCPGRCAPQTTKLPFESASRLNSSWSIDWPRKITPLARLVVVTATRSSKSRGAVWLTVKSQSRARRLADARQQFEEEGVRERQRPALHMRDRKSPRLHSSH